MSVCKDLASIEKFNNTNYSNWAFKIENLLIKDDLFKYVVDGPPSTPDVAHSKNSARVNTVINLCIEDTQIVHVKNLQTLKEIWGKLKTIHQRANLSSKLFLLRKLYS